MVEPGLAALYEKFCETYGYKTGKAILGLIGAAVAVFCLGVLISAGSSFYGFIHDLIIENGRRTELSEIIFIVLFIVLIVIVAANMASRIIYGPDWRALDNILREGDDMLKSVSKLKGSVEDQLSEVEELSEIVVSEREILANQMEKVSNDLSRLEEAEKTVSKARTSLKDAIKDGKLEQFIKEHELDPDGDLDKLDELIKSSKKKQDADPLKKKRPED